MRLRVLAGRGVAARPPRRLRARGPPLPRHVRAVDPLEPREQPQRRLAVHHALDRARQGLGAERRPEARLQLVLGGEALRVRGILRHLPPLEERRPVRLVERLEVEQRRDAVRVLGEQVPLGEEHVLAVEGRQRRQRDRRVQRRRRRHVHQQGVHEEGEAPRRLLAPGLRLARRRRQEALELLGQAGHAREVAAERVETRRRVLPVPEEAALVREHKGQPVQELAGPRAGDALLGLALDDDGLAAVEQAPQLLADRVAERVVRAVVLVAAGDVLGRRQRVLFGFLGGAPRREGLEVRRDGRRAHGREAGRRLRPLHGRRLVQLRREGEHGVLLRLLLHGRLRAVLGRRAGRRQRFLRRGPALGVGRRRRRA
mmetsp:Transcript_14170/g.46273  ORF Transcript_14170/g.46273 Transcript_14170/m.46273 type:complete len:371 (+) Transcript_14170:2550-3662(+)